MFQCHEFSTECWWELFNSSHKSHTIMESFEKSAFFIKAAGKECKTLHKTCRVHCWAERMCLRTQWFTVTESWESDSGWSVVTAPEPETVSPGNSGHCPTTLLAEHCLQHCSVAAWSHAAPTSSDGWQHQTLPFLNKTFHCFQYYIARKRQMQFALKLL